MSGQTITASDLHLLVPLWNGRTEMYEECTVTSTGSLMYPRKDFGLGFWITANG